MEYINLKNSSLSVSRLCIGGDPFGGHGWGKVSQDDVAQAVNTAIDVGINFFDTADVYGLGESERILGRTIATRRQSVVLATKFGVRRSNDNTRTFYDNSPKWIRTALSGSLKRFNTDYIDLYQLHYRDGITSIETIVETLDALKQEGLIRYYGLSNIYKKDIIDIIPYRDKFISFQDEYSLANRRNEDDIVRISNELKISPMTWGSLGQGILTGKYGRDVVFDAGDRRSRETYNNFHGDKLQHNIDIVDKMSRIAARNKQKLSAIAIRYILDFIKDSIVIVGVKTKDQVLSNLEAFGWSLTQKEIDELEVVSRE